MSLERRLLATADRAIQPAVIRAGCAAMQSACRVRSRRAWWLGNLEAATDKEVAAILWGGCLLSGKRHYSMVGRKISRGYCSVKNYARR